MEPYQIAQAGIARTYQNINLFSNLTVLENVKSGRHIKSKSGLTAAIFRTPAQKKEEAAIHEKMYGAADVHGLGEKADLLAKNLSYGEQRRLEIARAMASEPQLLLLDEPAAGMNSTEKVELTEMIRKIRDAGITILLVEHDMKLVMRVTDRIAVLNFGKMIALMNRRQYKITPKSSRLIWEVELMPEKCWNWWTTTLLRTDPRH